MRRLKSKQRGPWCDWCKEDDIKTRAVWRGFMFSKFACEDHREHLESRDEEQQQRDSYQTDAEFQLGVQI